MKFEKCKGCWVKNKEECLKLFGSEICVRLLLIENSLCWICKLDEYCQHNYDYECQEVYDFLKGESVPIWAINILIKEVSRSG